MKRAAIAATILLLACTDRKLAAPCFDLEEVRRFGQAEASPADTRGVLGDVRGVVPGSNGEVFVLDRHWQKIVVFRADGSVERVITGGEGEGPGEFRLPMHLASNGRGVSVIDYELRRITEFDWSGQFLRLARLPGPPPWRHLTRGDTAWITFGTSDGTSSPVFHAVGFDSKLLSAGPPLDADDRALGTGLGMAFGAEGELLINTARPGVWLAYTNAVRSRRGIPLFPDDGTPVTTQTGPQQYRVTPAQHTAAGLALLGDSIVLQGIFSLPRPFEWNDPPRRDEGTYALGVFGRDGTHRTTLPLPAGVSTVVLSSDAATGRIFMHTSDPFPQAIEFALRRCATQP